MNNGAQAGEATDLLSSSQVAEALATTQSRVTRMAAAGLITPAFQGQGTRGPRYYKRADVEVLVRQERADLERRLRLMAAAAEVSA